MRRATLYLLGVWLAGLSSLVPLAVVRLLFWAPREEYALLATFILFWIFGYWPIVGPTVAAIRLRSFLKTLERASGLGDVACQVASADVEADIEELMVEESGLPRFLARPVVRRLLAMARASREARPGSGIPFRIMGSEGGGPGGHDRSHPSRLDGEAER